MKNLLFSILLLITVTACGPQKSSQNKSSSAVQKASTAYTTYTEIADSLMAKPSADFVTGRFDQRSNKYFVKVPKSRADDGNTYLQKATYRAFKAMADSAEKDGITFTIVSGTRNFYSQKSIWDRKWQASDSTTAIGKAKGILEYSSMPMTSRHHWGTDIDLNNLNNSYFASGQGLKEYKWLKAHANDFGFYQPYTDKSLNGRTGYNEEKWHWSYMPLAGPYLKYYNQNLSNADIKGFKGSELADELDMVKNYVNGVSKKVKQYGK